MDLRLFNWKAEFERKALSLESQLTNISAIDTLFPRSLERQRPQRQI